MSQPTEQGPGSVSRIECAAQVRGKGIAKLSLFRHLAPLTVNAIHRAMPLESRVNIQPAMRCLFTSIRVGVEKPRLTFERGEVAFLASGGLLCIFVKGAKSAMPLNPVGKVEEGLGIMDSLTAGDVVRLVEGTP
ncbi:MAG: hypothetical protein LYZ66_07175 [Nitrososphaerales archaeon]|nr:hypothetical protein [Nitrososphaerales archaeon]